MTTNPAARQGLGARALRKIHRGRVRRGNGSSADQQLVARVAALEAAVAENRRLNQRLADVVDIVTEVLVPAADRDDERLRKALADLGKTLDG